MSELLFRENAYLKSCEATVIAVHGDAVELDRTVFYPLGGGQAGDSGRIGAWRVLDTRKGPLPDQVLHVLEPGTSASVGAKVEAQLDWERRHRLMRLHTALHLLGAVVKAPVTGGPGHHNQTHVHLPNTNEPPAQEPPAPPATHAARTATAPPP